MATTTTVTTTSTTKETRLPLAATPEMFPPEVVGEQWYTDLVRDGYAVVKGAVPRERAMQYASDIFSYLEDFKLGFDRNDPSTIHKDKLPVINEKGMCIAYGISHEDFTWKVRSEPGVISAFEKVYQTEDLIVSFDAVNVSFPNRKDIPENKPWPHQDQDPKKPGFRCLQGLVNLLPNGPDDGGLIVCKGAHTLSEEYHEAFKNEDPIPAWTNEWYGFKETGMKWLADKGCEWVKVCAEPGDLLIWDSRTPHYNRPSTSQQPRFCVYTCFMPVADTTQEDLLRKKDAYERRVPTSHWPNATFVGNNESMRDGKPDPYGRLRPVNDLALSERAFKLTGIPYIQPTATVA